MEFSDSISGNQISRDQRCAFQIPVEFQKCCVCTGNSWRSEAKSLHPIPSHNAVVQMRWFSFIRRTRGPDWTPKDDNNIPLVCSLHFTSRSYQSGSLSLKTNVVPFLDPKESSRKTVVAGRSRKDGGNGDKNLKSRIRIPGDDKEKYLNIPRSIPIIQPLLAKGAIVQPLTVEHGPGFCFSDPLEMSEVTEATQIPGILFGMDTRMGPGELESEIFNFSPEPYGMSQGVIEGSALLSIPLTGSGAQIGSPLSKKIVPEKTKARSSGARPCRQVPRIHSIVLPKSSSSGNYNQNDGYHKALLLLPTITHPSSLHFNSEPFQSMTGVSQVESPLRPMLDLDSFKKVNEVKPVKSMPINFCLVCGGTLNPDLQIKPDEVSKSRKILFSMLNFQVDESEMGGTYPVCFECNKKVFGLQKCLDSLLEIQKEMEKQRNRLLQDIVRTFCIRSQKNVPLSFASATAVHEYITRKWASTLRPPYETHTPDCSKGVDLVKNVIAERKLKRTENRRKNNLKKRLAREAEIGRAELEAQQKRDDRRRLLAEAQERRLRGEKVRRYRCGERIQCPICQLELQKLSLRKHMLIHNCEPRHSCSLCSKSFLRLDALRNHELTHKIGEISFGQMGRSFQCPYCDLILSGGKRYFQHVATSHLSSTEAQVDCNTFYDCDVEGCKLSISKTNEFHQHLLTHSESPVVCSSCGKHFAIPSSLALHEQIHASPDSFYDCIFCQRYFESATDLKNHQFFHKISVDPRALKFICELCGAKFVSGAQLFSHKSYHSRSKVRLGGEIRKYQLYICEVCGAEFNAETRLKMHSYEHTHPEGFACEQCKKVFPNPTKLWFHRKRNKCSTEASKALNSTRLKRRSVYKQARKRSRPTPAPEKPGCTEKESTQPKPKKAISSIYSSITFTTIREPKIHKKNDYPCKHCSVILKNLYILRRHNLLFHPEIYVDGKTFICPVCWKNYPTQEELDEHCHAHDRSKCKECNKLFPSVVKLQQHMRTHTGEKPFKCQYCDKCFNLETNLKEHELRHTGNRPYRCSYCNSGFFRKKQLQQHIAKIHPQEEVQVQTITESADDPPSLEINSNPESHPITESTIDNQVIIEQRQRQNSLLQLDFSNFVGNF